MPLPPSLAPSSSNALTVEDVYQTTTGTAHSYKPSETFLQQPSYKKAPGSWKVNYTRDTLEKVRFYSQPPVQYCWLSGGLAQCWSTSGSKQDVTAIHFPQLLSQLQNQQ